MASIGFADIVLNVYYENFEKYVDEVIFLGIYNPLPHTINYFFILLLMLNFLWLRFLYFRLHVFHVFGSVSQKGIVNKLNYLIDRIDANLTLQNANEYSLNTGSSPWFRVSNSKEKRMPMAGINDIEQLLIEILDDIDQLPNYVSKPEFTLIFDELDKIEPKEELLDDQKKKTGEYKADGYLFNIESSRNRQQAIYKLLSNLKHFLTTAKSKFIFIAGREMYDAYLADVSDRNFFNRSIFNQVIYVQSFLSESADAADDEIVDITGLTERYVCQFLFPVKQRPKFPSLKSYNKYLLENFPELNENTFTIDIEKITARQKREKIIFTLHHFIIYLMHISNGAPKKITSTFEKFTLRATDIKENKYGYSDIGWFQNHFLIVGNNSSRIFLEFDQDKQYYIGMISSLVNPIIYSIGNKVQDYNDKILVSATFLINHIFKFHNYGFSWRNLENTPEVIEIHKTPEFRDFITILMQYLIQTHIEEIVSGVFDFKFPKRITKEIGYLSKISEEGSAAFNFTLDEQLLLKHFYLDELKMLEDRYRNRFGSEGINFHLQSIATIHIILGDIYFHEEDLGKAINEYLDGIHFLRTGKIEDKSIYEFVVLVRSMLKLGLAMERRKTYDSAFSTYGELANLIIRYRNIKLDKLGLELCTKDDSLVFVKKREKRNKTKIDERFNENVKQPNFRWLKEDLVYEEHDFIGAIAEDITPEKSSLLFKVTAFEGIKSLYQAFLAKLQVIEKGNLGGITHEDLKRIEGEFRYLNKIIRIEEKYLLETEFWNKVGDILYYKNGLISSRTNRIYDNCKQKKEKKYTCLDICGPRIDCKNCEKNRQIALKDGRKIPCKACEYYDKSLENLVYAFINWPFTSMKDFLLAECSKHKKIVESAYSDHNKYSRSNESKPIGDNLLKSIKQRVKKKKGGKDNSDILLSALFDNKQYSKDNIYLKIVFYAYINDSFISKRKNSFKTLAGLLSDIGDTRFSCANKHDEINEDRLNKIICAINYSKTNTKLNEGEGKPEEGQKPFYEILGEVKKLEAAIVYYYLAALFYKKAKEFKNYSFQLTKIIHLLKEYCEWNLENEPENTREERIKTVGTVIDKLEDVATKILRSHFGAFENIHSYMIERYRNIFDESRYDPDSGFQSWLYSNYVSLKKIPIDTEIDDLVFTLNLLKITCGYGESDKSAEKENNKYPNSKFDSSRIRWIGKMFRYNLASPYLIENSMFNRILKLRFKEHLNYEMFKYYNFKLDFDEPVDLDFIQCLRSMLIKSVEGKIPSDLLDPDFNDIGEIIKQIYFVKKPKAENAVQKVEAIHLLEMFEFLIVDSIYCLLEVIKTYNIFGQSFIFNHSYMAQTHLYLVRWLHVHYNYSLLLELIVTEEENKQNIVAGKYPKPNRVMDVLLKSTRVAGSETPDNQGKKIEKIKQFINELNHDQQTSKFYKAYKNRRSIDFQLDRLIDLKDKPFKAIIYQAERAIKHYYSAIEVHSEGRGYQDLLENMYFLNDDFNDKLFHFRLAQERYRINTGKIDKDLEAAKRINRNSSLYVVENYLITQLPKY